MHIILVVDDDRDSGKMLAKLLTNLGEKALHVSSGQLALDSLELHIPRLVILDMMMPEMDGIDVLRQIRSNPKTACLPVVMFSAMSDPVNIADARRNGATDFWAKGRFDFSTLRQLVAPYLALGVMAPPTSQPHFL
jgi:CheY-like chemotaxis protein